jgi:hypothetical protein
MLISDFIFVTYLLLNVLLFGEQEFILLFCLIMLHCLYPVTDVGLPSVSFLFVRLDLHSNTTDKILSVCQCNDHMTGTLQFLTKSNLKLIITNILQLGSIDRYCIE